MAKVFIACALLVSQALGLGFVNYQLIPGADGLAPSVIAGTSTQFNLLRDPSVELFLGSWYPNSQVEEFVPVNGFFLCDPANVNINGADETFKRPLDFGAAFPLTQPQRVCRVVATTPNAGVALLNQVLVNTAQCSFVRLNGLTASLSCSAAAVLGTFDRQPGGGNRAMPNTAHVSLLQSSLQYEGFPVPDGFLLFDSNVQLYQHATAGSPIYTTIDAWRPTTVFNSRQVTENVPAFGAVAVTANLLVTLENRIANFRLNA